MLDRGSFWTSPEPTAGVAVARLRVSVVAGLHQLVMSGAPAAMPHSMAQTTRPPIGFNDVAEGATYAAAVARDRMLIVSDHPLGVTEGWDAASGIAATVMDDAWTILDVEGEGLGDLLSMATTIDPGERTPSSALLFASAPCIAYRHGSPATLRVHVERPLAPFLLDWIRQAMESMSASRS